MPAVILLDDIHLLPVLELEPFKFATTERPRPHETGLESPEDWHRYWLDSLADSGITGLTPLRLASWHVPTRDLTAPQTLQRILAAIINHWGGIEALDDPNSRPVLNGGLALLSGGEVVVTPTCCSDLGNLSDWREAAGYRGTAWQILWTGHPWLSVCFDGERLVLCEPHESDSPVGRWSVRPEELARAVSAAEEELEFFAGRLESALRGLGIGDGAGGIARQLEGFAS